MRDPAYLGDLGGLSAHRQLIMLNLRGTGQSAIPEDAATYRCDRLVDDVEALRQRLGLETMDLLAHSAGANLAALYVSRYPERVGRLALITPSVAAVGVAITGDDRLEVARHRKGEPWFDSAFAALGAIVAGEATEADWQAIAPFFHGRWDAAAQALEAADAEQRNDEAAAAFGAAGAFDPDRTRATFARFAAPVFLLTGELDLNSPPCAMAEYAGLFANATLVSQPGAGHYPWLDDAERFVAAVAAFLN